MEQVCVTELSASRPRPADLPAFLPRACGQLEAPFRVRVLLQTIEEYVSKTDDKGKKAKRDKVTTQPQTSTTQYSNEKRESVAQVAQDYGDEDEVVIRALCDQAGRPVELLFYHCTQIPRLLIKILGLCIPYHSQLAKITIRWGPLDGSAIYEIAKFLPLSQITEICLDDSPVPHRNYHLLLEYQSQLKSLSLARCDLVDEDVTLLASKLVHPLAASRTLAILSLESNNITDKGAHALGEALRTNRSLRHLNLLGNRLTNLGAMYIFRSLIRFPVSFEELVIKRKRIFEYLKMKQETYNSCFRELTAPTEVASDSGGRGRRKTVGQLRSRKASTVTLTSKKGSAVDALAYRAEALANELIGPYSDPFDAAEMVTQDDIVYCVGNFSLCYLNLAYNDLDGVCATRLAEVLKYQAEVRRVGGGLMRVVLEGSRMEGGCAEAVVAAAFLERSVAAAADLDPAIHKLGRKSERAKIKTS